MSTSGNINYTTSAGDIVTEALELLGVLGEGESYTAAQYTSSSRTLNMLIKNWQAAGLNLFAVQRTRLFLKKGQSEYTLSAGTADHYTNADGAFTGKVTAPAASGATTVVLEDVGGLSPTMKIGVQLSSGTDMFWTTIAGIAGLTVSLLRSSS